MTTLASEIVTRVLVRCLWPATNAPLTDAEILSLADDEITGTIRPLLLSAQGDWLLAYEDHAITADQATYTIPESWGPIKDLLYVDTTGQQVSLSIVNIEELGRLHRTGSASQNAPYVAYVDGDHIGLHPVPTTTQGTLRIRYYQAPLKLVMPGDEALAIYAVYTDTYGPLAIRVVSGNLWDVGDVLQVVNVNGTHPSLGTFTVTDLPEHLLGAGWSVLTGTFSGTESDLVAGHYVADEGYTPLVQIPDHLVPLLVSRVALQCLSAVGDTAGFQRSATIAGDLEKRALPTLDPRNESEPRVIRPRSSPLRGGFRRGWY